MVATPDEDGWYLLPDGRKTATVCLWCKEPYMPKSAQQKRCGKSKCKHAEIKADPERWAKRQEQIRAAGKRYVQRHPTETKARKRAYDQKRKTVAVALPTSAPSDPWAAASPEASTHLPGAWRELVLDPAPHTPIPHTHVSSVHGIVSTALGRDHDRTRADFVLGQARVPSGWGVYFVDGADARRMSCAPMPGLHLERRPWGVCFGPSVVTPRRPAPARPGRYTVEIATLSPVVIRRTVDGKILVRVAPTAPSLRASLTGLEFLRRCGLADKEVPAWTKDAALVLVDHHTRRDAAEVHGHWNAGDGAGHGRIVGWTGTVTVDVNAVTLWLLRHAEIVGLGGRVACGFGQVRLRVLTP